jgi:integrase
MAKLTDRSVQQARPKANSLGEMVRREIADAGCPGLYLVVQPSGAKSWAFRYRHAGLSRKLTLGSYPAVSLQQARRRAREAQNKVSEGNDPAAEKKKLASDMLPAVAADFIAHYVRPNDSPSWAKEVERQFAVEILPKWKNKRIGDIVKGDVTKLLRSIVERGSPITANRTLAVVRRFFNWCFEQGILDKRRGDVSPCEDVKAPSKENTRDRVLSDHEIKLLWNAAEQVGYPFGPMSKLLLLTGQRLREVAKMTWSEIDDDQREWKFRGERAKNDEAHIVPLSDAAVEIISGLPKIECSQGYLFTTTGKTPVSGFTKARDHLDERMGSLDPRWTLHDLRRSCCTGLAKLRIPQEVADKVLNHKSGKVSGVGAIYNRHEYLDERREALQAWANKVLEIVGERAADNVLQFGGNR